MNIYDKQMNQWNCTDNRGIEMASKKMYTQGKERVRAQISDFTVIICFLGMVDKILFPQKEIKLSSHILSLCYMHVF